MKKILTGLIVLIVSTMAFGFDDEATGLKGKFRMGIEGIHSQKTKENGKKSVEFKNGVTLQMAELFEVTNRVFLGIEGGVGSISYNNANYIDDQIGRDNYNQRLTANIGLAGEVNLIEAKSFTLYLKGSIGINGVNGKTDVQPVSVPNAKEMSVKKELLPEKYYKLGVGVTFKNGVGLEAGYKQFTLKRKERTRITIKKTKTYERFLEKEERSRCITGAIYLQLTYTL